MTVIGQLTGNSVDLRGVHIAENDDTAKAYMRRAALFDSLRDAASVA